MGGPLDLGPLLSAVADTLRRLPLCVQVAAIVLVAAVVWYQFCLILYIKHFRARQPQPGDFLEWLLLTVAGPAVAAVTGVFVYGICTR